MTRAKTTTKREAEAKAAKLEAQARAAEAKAEREEILLADARLKARRGPRENVLHPTDLALAEGLGITKGYLSKLKRRGWFPAKGANGWDESTVRAAIVENLPTGRELIGEPRRELRSLDDADDSTAAALEVLRNSTDPLKLAQAGTMIQARKLASSYEVGDLGSREINGLKAALAEWRQAESGHIDLARKRGLLVPKATVEIVGATLARYLLRAQEGFEAMLAAQVERWLEGNTFEDLNVEQRQHEVTKWARRRSRELREAVADGLDDLVADALREASE